MGFTLFAGGTYPFKSNESVSTETELRAIAKPANSGLKVMPKKGYSAPAAAPPAMATTATKTIIITIKYLFLFSN